MTNRPIILGVLTLLAAGCARNVRQDPAVGTTARADLEAKSGSGATGQATFTATEQGVLLDVTVRGAPRGLHGIHLHEKGDCSAPDAESAGDHWNPSDTRHGELGAPPAHLGDIGNIYVAEDGSGTLNFSTRQWTIGTGAATDITGKALVVHAGRDDLSSQPSGDSGGRIACGVVR